MMRWGVLTERLLNPPVALAAAGKKDPDETDDHASGRAREGFSTKIHLVGDGGGIPIRFELSPRQAHEKMTFEDLFNGIDKEMLTGNGEPAAWPEWGAGDQGYPAKWIDQILLDNGVTPVIRSKTNEDRDERPVEFDKLRSLTREGFANETSSSD
jgi:hypothetical protein